MKKYILTVMLVFAVLPAFAKAESDCDCYCVSNKVVTPLKSLIGKKIHRTRLCGINSSHVIDKSYMGEPRKLIDVTCKYIILEPDITNFIVKNIKLDRKQWDDGYWEEWKAPKRLIANEMIGTETFHTIISPRASNYYCIRCGKLLFTNPVGWYCKSCKTGWDIKEE